VDRLASLRRDGGPGCRPSKRVVRGVIGWLVLLLDLAAPCRESFGVCVFIHPRARRRC